MNKILTDKTLVEELVNIIDNKSKGHKLFIVGISGLDASGKSTISRLVDEKLREQSCNSIFISGDSFQFPKEYKNDLVEDSWALQHIKRTVNFDSMINDFLKPLQTYPETLNLKMIDYDTGENVDKEIELKYPLVVVLESIYLFQPDLLDYIDYKVYLDISTKVALERAKERPRDLFLYKDEKGIEEKYSKKNFAGNALFMEKYNPIKIADIVIDNNEWRSPSLIREK